MNEQPPIFTDAPPARRLRRAWRSVFAELPQCCQRLFVDCMAPPRPLSSLNADLHVVRELVGRIDRLPGCAFKLSRLRRLDRRLSSPQQLELHLSSERPGT